ncbi:MAG: hypothetical protein JW936_00980 [Sedimentisphaerales bacterium]|nr:hypothetical protein [Sedimentisphaerales bacterium]
MRMLIRISVCLVLCVAVRPAIAEYNPFAAAVIDISLNEPNSPAYCPAPGQWIKDSDFNEPNVALGAPIGAGLNQSSEESVVSLGAFGGQIVLAFDHDVLDDPANSMGMDAIVFGNAFLVLYNPQYHFAEPATIEIMPELNDNEIPGDDPGERWFLIAGSHLSDTSTYRSKTWIRGGATQPANDYPTFTGWPDSYDTAAYEVAATYVIVNNIHALANPNRLTDPNTEGYWGYAEYSPTLKLGDRDADDTTGSFGDACDMPAELFYTIPDDPIKTGITQGSGGGDAFDIKWAVDPDTFAPANLTSFRYIRITTAVDARFSDVGDISAEIDAVADVRPVADLNCDGNMDAVDLALFAEAWLTHAPNGDFYPAADCVVDNIVNLDDFAFFAWAWSRQ